MFIHSDCNKKVAEEALKRIELYRGIKDNNCFDDFYRSHLDCFESLIEDWKAEEEKCLAVICQINGHECNDGTYSSTFMTVCKSPHWGSHEGFLWTSGLYDATKFGLSSEDLQLFLNYLRKAHPDNKYEIVRVPREILCNPPKELWSEDAIRGNFDITGTVGNHVIKEF